MSLFRLGVVLTVISLSAEAGSPCAADIAKFCSDVPISKALGCLAQHRSELSPSCQQAGEKAKKQMGQILSICGSDIRHYCSGVIPGGGRILKCVQQEKSKFAPSCRKEIARAESMAQW